MDFPVRYSKTWAAAMLVLGIVSVLIQVVLSKFNFLSLAPGVLCLALGISYSTRSYFTVLDDQLIIKAAIGPAKKIHTFVPGDLVLRDGVAYLSGKKLGLRRWLANPEDWDLLRERLASQTFE